ncbi:uncharacterized protein E0L32_012321 [Thyridium curvatum]|uniref:Protein kinase domain-containing protein n=1 Tax=Thyridium curvatum TaxID=1093900 RepID=A0A507BI22_9PEZI|nr:uncharacterized protein E0L32_012321 [Thyridium curvatum]TPX17029.1 hypothetical protein E0L32_012321 [Thyridium curvatum]
MVKNYLPPSYETWFGDEDEDDLHQEPLPKLSASEYAEGLKRIPAMKVQRFISESDLNKGLDKWLPRPTDPMATRRILRDSVFQPISELLVLFGKGEWSLRPRAFAVLKMLQSAPLLDCFVKEGLTDSALPYTESNLPAFIRGAKMRAAFFKFQRMVLCKEESASDMEDGGKHLHLPGSGDDYFRLIKTLGTGRFGVVDHVCSRNTCIPYARKRVLRGHSALDDERQLRQFESEIQALKRLYHPHIVKLKGSYTDPKYLGIIMTPVAQVNLDEYLREMKLEDNIKRRLLRSFFGCLSTALAYLHQQNVRHNDIKPQNILVLDSRVYLSDFGTSRAWGTEGESTTRGKHSGYTPRYCAPETLETGARNTASDIWSLGCVFLEMATVLHRFSVADMYEFFTQNGSMRSDAIHANPAARRLWLAKLERSGTGEDAQSLALVSEMLVDRQEDRPTAAQLRGQLIDYVGPYSHICPYCALPDGLSQTQSAKSLAEAKSHQQTTFTSDDVNFPQFPQPELPVPVTAEALHLPERTPAEGAVEEVPIMTGSKELTERDRTVGQRAPLIRVIDANDTLRDPSDPSDPGKAAPTRLVRFSGLPEEIRPMPTGSEVSVDEDDGFISPEPIKPPPFWKEDSLPLPAATLAPSYMLAGTNHFSQAELSAAALFNPVESNVFVYGRLMFPGVLHAVADASTEGVYSRSLRRRLHPSSADWAKADLSIKHAAEVMTPAELKGYDRWWPRGLNHAAAIQESHRSKRILELNAAGRSESLQLKTSSKVTGFLVLGVRADALRYLDLILRRMAPPSDDDQLDRGLERHETNYFKRVTIDVDVQLVTGETRLVQAQTYVWTQGVRDLCGFWSEDRFLRSPLMQSLAAQDSSWKEQEQALATTMKMSFALVGDYLCGPIIAGNFQDLAVLLKSGFDPNAACRYYGFPLHAAVSVGHEDMVRLLLEHGAKINASGGQYGTPLIAAAYGSRKAIMKLLLHHDANVFARDNVHVGALYQGVAHGDYAITEMLLEHGAWLCQDWTEIADLAAELKDVEIQALLSRYDVRKIHLQYLLSSHSGDKSEEETNRIEASTSDSDDTLITSSAVSTWGTMSKSKVLSAVLRKAATASRMSGNWKGRRGVTVLVAALNAGAPIDLIGRLRDTLYPIKAVISMLCQQDGEQEIQQLRDGEQRASDEDELSFTGREGLNRRSEQITGTISNSPTRQNSLEPRRYSRGGDNRPSRRLNI